jgi:RNA ligase (TIGR02306 family)
MRKLATVRVISKLSPIKGADRIEVATIDGWEVVTQKAMGYKVGDLVVYFEIDSWIPTTIAPFLTAEHKTPREYKGILGEKLKTVKLRGQVSQGLIILPSSLKLSGLLKIKEGLDLSEVLGVIKWEQDEPVKKANNVGPTKNFPTNLFPKTDQERIQNCFSKVNTDDAYEGTLKLDGSSCSIFMHENKLRVCSRNVEIEVYKKLSWWDRIKQYFGFEVEIQVTDNNFARIAHQHRDKIKEGLVIQGELMGPGIQKNREEFEGFRFFCYDLYSIKSKRYYSADTRLEYCGRRGIEHAPVLTIGNLPFKELKEALDYAEELKSIKHPVAEGVVYKSIMNPSFSFKVISNKYLLKEE